MSAAEGRRRARVGLALGALAGVALAALSLVRSGAGGPGAAAPGDGAAVAWIDGEPISREAFARFVGAAARERGTLTLDDATRRALLERLIDEELLLREGLALGLAQREPTARRAIVNAAMDRVTGLEAAPDRADLEALRAEAPERWLRPGPVRLEAARVPVAGRGPAAERAAAERAGELARRVRAGEALPALAAAADAVPEPPLPGEPVAVAALRDRLPGTALEAVIDAEPGAVVGPVRGADGFWVLRVVEKGPSEPAPFEAIRGELEAAWRAREHERRLREHLAALRAAADVRIAADAAQASPPAD